MADKKNQGVKITTPRGIAVWPHLNKPDMRWNPEIGGEYTVEVRFERTAPGVQEMLDQLDELYQQSIADAKAEGIKKAAGEPYADVIDPETKQETGEVSLKFKARAAYKNKDTGELEPARRIPFLVHGVEGTPPLDRETELVYGGSEVQVQFMAVPGATKAVGAFLQRRLLGVCVHNLVGPEGMSAAEAGFDLAPAPAIENASSAPATSDDLDEDY